MVAGGAISANGHGNVSIRVPGADEIYTTSAPSLQDLGRDGIARLGLDGSLREGQRPPIQGAVVAKIPGQPREAALQRAVAFAAFGTRSA